MANLNKIVYLTEAQKDTLFANGSITVNDITVEYNENDLYITPQEDLTSVALSGDYEDLINKPTIPANISDLTNDAGYITSSDIPDDKVFMVNVTLSSLTTGTSDKSFTEISNAVLQDGKIPFVYIYFLGITLIAPLARLETNYAVFTYEDQTVSDHQNYACLRIYDNNATIVWRDKYIAENELAAVATSGDYNDLNNTPVIPSKMSDLTNDVGYLTSHQDLSAYAPLVSPALTGTPTAPTAEKGTKTTQIATTEFVQSAISNLGSVLNYKGVKATISELPASSNVAGDVWHVTENNGEYAWDGAAWQELGSAIDLSGYALSSNLATVATSGAYSDLSGTPTIDTTITQNSTNAISSGAVYDAIGNIETALEALL